MSILSDGQSPRELSFEQKLSMVRTLPAAVAAYIAEDEDIDIATAFRRFYDSSVAVKLDNLNNLLYREGPGYIYEMYKDDRRHG